MTTETTAQPYKDRRAGLVVFGIVQVLLGLLALLMIGLTFVSFAMATHASQRGAVPPPAMSRALLFFIVGTYLPVATWFLVLGIASMMPRRWAWALLLVQSWIWLVFGLMTAAVMITMGNRIFPPMPPGQAGARAFALGCMVAVLGIFFILLPVAFVLFYRSPNVKATVWARDPRPRWTDRIPLSVLGGGLVMTVCGPMILMSSVTYKGLPLGRTIVHGWAALAILLAVAVLATFSGVQLLRLRRSGWWGTAVFEAIAIAWGISVLGADAETWRGVLGMNVPREQFDTIVAMYRGPLFFGWMALIWALYVGFLWYIRRYFFRPDSGDGRGISVPAV